MSNFYKLTDPTLTAEIIAILDERVAFVKKWHEYAVSLGFDHASITKGNNSLCELQFKGFAATHEQFNSVDKEAYRFVKNKRDGNYKEYSVWDFRRSNKKAYKNFVESAPFDPKVVLTLEVLQQKLVKDYSPVHGVGETHKVGDEIIFGVGGLLPVAVKEGIAKQILKSEFLALQGL